VPIRIEPKVFFANERTYLSWINLSVFLGGAAVTLINLGNTRARLSGYAALASSIVIALYALGRFQWRAAMIRRRDPKSYDDRIGPVLVIVAFIFAMAATVGFSSF
jgi:uncharacterized membrane protein YidH (DUF202 family)